MNRNAYQRFVSEYLEASSYERRDGVPVELLDQLSNDDKERAENELIQRLSPDDSWPIIGLGHLCSAKAVPAMRSLLPGSHGSIKAEIATALWKIEGDESMLAIVLQCSRFPTLSSTSPYREFVLVKIIYCLAQFPHDAATIRLEELTESEEYLVSANAKQALEMRKDHYE